jgi:hypothetical protein
MTTIKTVLLAGCLLATGLIVPSLQGQNFTFTTIAGGSQGGVDDVNADAPFHNPAGVAVDGGGNLYVADQANNLIRKISPQGTNWIVTTLAGGAPGSLDGANSSAQFSGPSGIAVDSFGNLYVADQYNSVIRQMTLSGTNWEVTTIAGTAGVTGSQNGANGGASFSNPTGIAVDGAGNLIVADELNNAIRKITPAGTNWIVTTIAGGTPGASDGANTAAQFFSPSGVAVDAGGRIFVADQFNNAIRLITPVGTNWVVTTIAGQAVSGLSDGLGAKAQFYAPLGVAVDSNDNVYVADEVNNAIRILVPSGANWVVSTIAGGAQGRNDGTGTNARFNLPFGVAADAYGDVFVADFQNNAIRLGVAAGSAPPTGGLQVMIVPSSAIAAGAEWQLDGGPLQTSGAILSSLVPGNHTISFNSAAGFTTPAVQSVSVTAHQTAQATGNYPGAVANAGSLQVTIAPVGAANAGAQWNVDSGAWQTNGGIVAGLSAGVHNLYFNSISGWTGPSSQVVTITNSQTTLATGTYVLQTGSLQVTILPAAVVTVGAKWQVDGGTLQASGATLSGLLPGSHTVSFNTALGWSTPADQQVTITNGQTTSNTGIYVQKIAGTGALQVTLLPSGAVNAGAQWQVDGSGTLAGGVIVSNLAPGLHSLTFTPVAGWTKPASQAVQVANGQTTLATGTYLLQTGSLQVTITPAGAVSAGAECQIDGGAFQSNGTTIMNLLPGSHTVAFNTITGWNTPASQQVTIANNQTSTAAGTYIQQTGALQITLSPVGAVLAGAEWQIDGGAFQSNGTTITNLMPGSHTVAFNTITGWNTPATQQVTIAYNQTSTAAGTYIQQFGSLQVTISPATAITAGAKWRVDGGTLQNSGVTVTNLPVGNHIVSFNTLSNRGTPANQTVVVTPDSTTTTRGTYLAIGSLRVTLGPAAALAAGARWQADNGTLQKSGSTVTNLAVGTHTVSFNTISGWTTASNQTITVRSNLTTIASGIYVAQTGALTVTINPASAATGAAKWQVDGGKLEKSGATVTNLSVGTHKISFNTISGWTTPANQSVSVGANATTAASGTYLPQTGSLEVTISPAPSISAGAQWRVDGGTLQKSGSTVGNLSVGTHTVGFSTVSGWTTPGNQTVSVKAKAVTKDTGSYTFGAQGIYNGLFLEQADATVGTAGMLGGLDVTASGTYSGKLLIGNSTNAISGAFNVSGQASNHVPRLASQGGPLTVEMSLNWNDSPPNITGTVSGGNGGGWVANLTAKLAGNSLGSAEYTLLVLPAGTPPGYGYLLITNHAGAITLSGALADGTSFIQQVPISAAGDLPVYGNLYGSSGLLLGWLGLESGSPAGSLMWIKEASLSSSVYPEGFTNLVSVQGSPWINPLPHTAGIDLPSGQLDISGGSLLSPLFFNVAVSNNNTLVKLAGSATNSLTGTNNPKTGLLTITFGNGSGKATTTGTGAVLQNVKSAGGFFLGKTNAGSILVTP